MKTIRNLFRRLTCRACGRNINAIGQDNMSSGGRPLCEDCYHNGH